MIEHLWTDDKTGRYSDTTLRTWLIFIVFFFYAVALAGAVLAAAFLPQVFAMPAKMETALSLFDALGIAAGGAGGLYAVKRINERRRRDMNAAPPGDPFMGGPPVSAPREGD